MICAYINGQVAYPATGSEIKVTLENPFIKSSGEKTMEVVFPMSMSENREIFGALNRIDTHFHTEPFEDCALVADNLEVIRGIGTVTSINENEVKMQIRAGSSAVRYKSFFDDIYIDKLNYGSILPRHEYLRKRVTKTVSTADFSNEMRSQGFIGNPGVYAFLPIHDESNDLFMNMPAYLQGDNQEFVGISMTWAAIQPNLMHVMKTVMSSVGYTVRLNEYDVDPWNRIYVASAKVTMNMACALPHWSVTSFLDEFRKTFNAVYLFDETSKSVDIVAWDSQIEDVEHCQAVEGFSSGFNEDGIEYLGSSNLTYSLSSNDRSPDFVSEEMMKAFETREYDSFSLLRSAFSAMDEKGKLTTVFKCPSGFFYGRATFLENGDIHGINLEPCGFFSPLVRNLDGSNIDLKMVPVAVSWQECLAYITHIYGKYPGREGTYFENTQCGLPFYGPCANIDNEENVESGEVWCYWSRYREKATTEYTTVQDVLEEGEGVPNNDTGDSVMQMIFAAGSTLYFPTLEKTGEITLVLNVDKVLIPMSYTDSRMFDAYRNLPAASMSLNDTEGVKCIGAFHNRGFEIRLRMNGNNEITIPFLFDGKPDPTKVYVFKNRKFICSKIEFAVSDSGISRLKTGYFYELLS